MREVIKRNVSFKSGTSNLWNGLKQTSYFCMSMVALLASACFPVVDKQFIALSLILGARWIVAGRTNKINIVIK